MIRKKIKLTNRLGLHIRPCSLIVKTATKYKADLKISNGEITADGKSMLDLMQLSLMYGDTAELIADGEDEKELLEEIIKLFENNFGED